MAPLFEITCFYILKTFILGDPGAEIRDGTKISRAKLVRGGRKLIPSLVVRPSKGSENMNGFKGHCHKEMTA